MRSNAHLWSASLNSYIFVHPIGVYLNLSRITACSQPNKKWSLDLSAGNLSLLAGDKTVLYVLNKEAFIPSAGSKTNLYDCLINVDGIFGENYAVKNNLKFGWGFKTWIFFSSSESQAGSRWTFLSITQAPSLTAYFIDFSAKSKPSELPMATEYSFVWSYLLICSTLKLGSNPGALESKIGYLALHVWTTSLKSRVFPSLHYSPNTIFTIS